MVPPVLVDMNKDGVKDILMSGFDGTMILFDGETLDVMWKVKFENRESYRCEKLTDGRTTDAYP